MNVIELTNDTDKLDEAIIESADIICATPERFGMFNFWLKEEKTGGNQTQSSVCLYSFRLCFTKAQPSWRNAVLWGGRLSSVILNFNEFLWTVKLLTSQCVV